MSFDDLQGSLSPDGQPKSDFVDAELDLFVAESEEIHADDSELLARLENADTVASGVEARLDEILGTLDDLLRHLEPIADGDTGDESQEATIPGSESQSKRPPSEQS